MNEPGHSLWLAKPELSDEAAAQLLEFLHELLTGFENAYFNQLHRYYANDDCSTESARSAPHIDPDKDPF